MSEDIMFEDPTGGRGAAGIEPDLEVSAADEAADEALLESLLVEEVSIDGMCGVY